MRIWSTTGAKGLAVTAALMMAAAGAAAQSDTAVPDRRRIVISVPDRKLALLEGDQVLKIYEIATGRSKTPTPTGTYNIVHRVPNPTYYYPGKVIPPGKQNPLGTRWLGLNCKGYGIHGTNNPRSIGRRASRGCIRMRNSDVEQLFELVSVGDEVELRGTRDEETQRIFGPPPLAADALKVASAAQISGEIHGN